jgi:hypothetical protein
MAAPKGWKGFTGDDVVPTYPGRGYTGDDLPGAVRLPASPEPARQRTQSQAEYEQREAETKAQQQGAENQAEIRGYAQGGSVTYKNSHPLHVEFSRTGDSGLLAKGRR